MSIELSESDDSLSNFLDATEKTSALMKSRTCDFDDRNDLIKDAMHGSVLHEDDNDLEMKWQGYATKYLKIILKPFQIDFMRAFHDKKDAIVVQATGSGKSTCFYLPAVMMPSHHFGILIVPTIALGEDHNRTFKSFGITSVFLNAASSQEDFKQAFDVLPESLRTKILIVQPEIIFGTNSNNGILGRLAQNQHRLNFITIDEGHLVFDWGGFRSDFKEIKKLRSLFICPITVLSATLKPSSLALMRKEILRDPVIIKGTIERPNVTLNILPYRKSSTSEAKENDGDVWYSTAKQIRDIVDGEKTIIYCAFATECEEIRPSLEKLNLKSACYTGKKSNKEKNSIFQQFKDENIDILVATKAFGLGINLPNIRHIIHIGLPENLAAWMQEYGRAGRDGHPAHAHLLVCDNEDMKKINFWIKNSDSEEQRDSLGNDLAVVWKYYSKAFTGECLRSYQLDYFEEQSNLAPIEPISCCSGCRIRVEVPLKPVNELYSVLRIFLFFKNRTIMRLCETQILDWTQGNAQNWMWLHFNLEDLQEEETYGCFKSLPESTTKILLKVILRQCLSKNFIELAFDSISNESKTIVKFFSISIDGCNIAKGDAEVPLLPDTKEVANILLRFESSRPDKPEKKRRRKGCDLVSRFTKMMELGEESWCKLDKRDQYELLGFHHDVKKLLYVEDYSKLKCCPDQRPLPNFLWEDNSLAKQSSFPKLPFTLSEGHPDQTKFIMQRSRCNGVKVCQGETERTGQCCTYATSNRVNENKCRKHPHAPLKQSGPCDGYFMYVRPECEEDKRRWLAFFTQDTEENCTHSHPMPVKSKIGSKVEQRIDIAVQNDPTLTAAEISKGIGTGCNLSSMTLVATDINKVRNAVYKSRKKVYSTYSASYILEHFDDVVKNRVDEADLKEIEDPELGKRILHASSPYCRLTRFEESGNFCYLATPQMLEVLNEARFIEADVTFPQTTAFPYVLNMASFNFETLKYQTVARVLMTKLTIAAYKVAFTTVLQLTTNIHPEFELGKDVRGWLLDFSSPQRDGLAASLGDQASSVIRGCLVHYKRGVKKVADKVNRNEESKSLFKKIAYAIPDLEEKEDVTFAFEILCGEASIEDEPTYDFLKNVIKVEVTDIESINTASWTGASEWVKWWSKPKITKMFTKSFTEMSDSDWNICPKTTNVVESQNKQGSTNTNAFLSVLDMFYRTDRKNCYETFAAREGYATGTSLEKRQEQNQRRILAQKRKRFDCGEQSSEDEHETKKTRKIPAAPKKNSARGKGLSKTTTKKKAAPDKGKGKRTPNQRFKTQNGKKPSVIDGAKRGKKIKKKSEDACTEKKDGAKRTIRKKSKKGRKAAIHTDENVTSDDQSEIEEGPSKAPTANENNDFSKKNQAVFRDENQHTSEEEEEDFIGKTVLVYTKISTSQIQTRHSKKEWYKSTVVSKNAAGAYVAQVENQKDATIIIQDMYDETTVKMNFVD